MFEGLTLRHVRRLMAKTLQDAGKVDGQAEAAKILFEIGGFDKTALILSADSIIDAVLARQLTKIIDRRIAGEPLDHILGYRYFGGRRFDITKDVLSPREETYLLVEQAISLFPNRHNVKVLDLGTGSGAILISILCLQPNWTGVGVDVSDAALRLSAANAENHDVQERASLIKSDWFENVSGQFDIILSNPPYITEAAMLNLEPEVANFDPDLALCGGSDGLDAYRHVIDEAQSFLCSGGYLGFEIGYDQGRSVPALLRQAGYVDIRLMQDLSGHDRLVFAKVPKNKYAESPKKHLAG